MDLLYETKDVIRIPRDDDYGTPLSWAARNGHEEVVKLLLTIEGVDPNCKASDRWAPLRLATRNLGRWVTWVSDQMLLLLPPLLLLLLLLFLLQLATNGMDPVSMHQKDSDRWMPLKMAAMNWCWLGFKLQMLLFQLLEAAHKIGLDPGGHDGLTPLSWAASNGHEAVVKLLLATDNIHPDSKNEYGETPLWFAAENGHEAVIKLLLATEGVDVNSRATGSFHSGTPLSRAAAKGHEAVVKLLLEKGARSPDAATTGYRDRASVDGGAAAGGRRRVGGQR
jgi:hypothetical protein